MSVAQSLDTPFERLAILPTTMNWRGGWSALQQYFRNDVVVSAVNFSTYILTTTSIKGGLDPANSTADVWIELSSPNTAVNSIIQGVGITVTGTTNPVITNNGVVTVVNGIGITKTGDANNVTLSNSGVLKVLPGNGITIGGSTSNPTVTNNGVRSIQQGTGISVDLTNPNIPSISNTGVLSVNQGAGITVDNSDPKNPIVSASIGFVNVIYGNSGTLSFPTMIPAICAASGGQSYFQVAANGLFASYLLNGPPSTIGIFLLNLTGFNLFFANIGGSPTLGSNTVTIAFVDTTTTPITTYTTNQVINLSVTAVYPISAPFPLVFFDVTAARTAGLRVLSAIFVTNNTLSPFVCPSTSVITTTYYPNGLE
jgi:hypothetical protein